VIKPPELSSALTKVCLQDLIIPVLLTNFSTVDIAMNIEMMSMGYTLKIMAKLLT
jgi:hypothetical protein